MYAGGISLHNTFHFLIPTEKYYYYYNITNCVYIGGSFTFSLFFSLSVCLSGVIDTLTVCIPKKCVILKIIAAGYVCQFSSWSDTVQTWNCHYPWYKIVIISVASQICFFFSKIQSYFLEIVLCCRVYTKHTHFFVINSRSSKKRKKKIEKINCECAGRDEHLLFVWREICDDDDKIKWIGLSYFAYI